MIRLRASLEVRAGVIPRTPEPELTKQFHYTEEEYEEDLAQPEEEKETTFVKKVQEAVAYSIPLMNPRRLNWVELTWIWY